ncbi:hypothetical protein Rhe02_79390 [Rhizocola hellebori]|uniref:DUF3151 domain-containing protein n=1 Tax=Rhizocola hellebori TaxID=1392758 RepID=A0A8J3QH01_9ACTN|nr:DUF3151 domain-containing protein [Rhizocola hellebori]GIH09872.1 hypothetical protein Rhe02_79390 [Rhizocola hellebori]
MRDLMPQPPATLLPDDPAVPALESGQDPASVAAEYPTSSAAWAALAQRALAADDSVTGHVAAYAFARTGYHRGLDQLRRSGWKGSGPVPWSHAPNRGFLRSLHALSLAAAAIGEADEAARCAQFVRDCDPAAADALA